MNRKIISYFAFTLTEVLIAVAIVGIIAGLVLPKVIENYQTKTMDSAYKREVQTIEDSINGLAVSENKADFFSTIMYKDTTPESYDDSSGAYMEKYLRTSKMCDNPKDCFAPTYYQYESGKSRSEYKPDYKGACAILKNGMSICMIPQIGAANITGIIDLNGKKGPNVLDRDLRTFSIAAKTRVGLNQDTEGVRKLDWDNIKGGEDEIETPTSTDPCDVDANSLDCCQARSITDASDPCCTYDEFKDKDVCSKETVISYNCQGSPSSGNSLAISCAVSITGNQSSGIRLEFTYPSVCYRTGEVKELFCNLLVKTISNTGTVNFKISYVMDGKVMNNWQFGQFGQTTIQVQKSGQAIKNGSQTCDNSTSMPVCKATYKYNSGTGILTRQLDLNLLP